MTRNKQILTPHQRQMRFFTCLFGTVTVLSALAILWLINACGPMGRFH